MNLNLRWEAWCAALAFTITLWFVLDPSPYPMLLFTFFAQPLFVIVAIFYLAKVVRELRSRRVL